METITFAQVKPSNVLEFAGSQYKVRSVIAQFDRVVITYHDTNEGAPYFYEPLEKVSRIS